MKECAIAIECADHVAAVGMATHDNADRDNGSGQGIPCAKTHVSDVTPLAERAL